MKFKRYQDARGHYKVGDVVWGCAYTCSGDKESKRFFQEPIKGQFTASNREVTNTAIMATAAQKGTYVEPRYFVPFKKNGIDLAWSKAVNFTARMYADTYAESVELYNDKIQEYIDWFENEVKEMKAQKI